jgi:hypothetical protein
MNNIIFIVSGTSRSMIGKRAAKERHDQPTMWLNLGGLDDKYKKHSVVHEFGHALGLGHEHQRSDFWKCIEPYVDVAVMKKYLKDHMDKSHPNSKMTNEEFEESFKVNWASNSQFEENKCTDYDPNSIMHYW